jgi:hypothetical protein
MNTAETSHATRKSCGSPLESALAAYVSGTIFREEITSSIIP